MACLAFLCVRYGEVYGTYLWWTRLIKSSGPHCGSPWSCLSINQIILFHHLPCVHLVSQPRHTRNSHGYGLTLSFPRSSSVGHSCKPCPSLGPASNPASSRYRRSNKALQYLVIALPMVGEGRGEQCSALVHFLHFESSQASRLDCGGQG